MLEMDMYGLRHQHQLLASFARYARAAWKEHTIEVVKAGLESFMAKPSSQGLDKAYLFTLSQMAGPLTQPLWTDGIEISTGQRAVPVIPVLQPARSSNLLSEKGAGLSLFQTVSGEVIATISLPQSKLLEPHQTSYIVGVWKNPRHMWHADVHRLLHLLYQVDMFCGVGLFPNEMGVQLHNKLITTHDMHANGKSRVWVWIRENISWILKAIGLVKGDLSAMKTFLRL